MMKNTFSKSAAALSAVSLMLPAAAAPVFAGQPGTGNQDAAMFLYENYDENGLPVWNENTYYELAVDDSLQPGRYYILDYYTYDEDDKFIAEADLIQIIRITEKAGIAGRLTSPTLEYLDCKTGLVLTMALDEAHLRVLPVLAEMQNPS